MADLNDYDDEVAILQLANDAVVPHSIAPESKLAFPQWLSKTSRILGCCDTLAQAVCDFALDRSI
jgi:hypothetical protein